MNPPAATTQGSAAARAGSRPVYQMRLSANADDLYAAQRLRFDVFNVELREGLAASWSTGLDADPFDEFCDHLLVEEGESARVVGTYRLQTGQLAAANLGYYSEQEFDFAPYEPFRCETVELGRACIHKDHRHLGLLHLLWRGIVAYAIERKARYLIGCSSVPSQDCAVGAAMFEKFSRTHLAPPALRTQPRPAWACPLDEKAGPAPPPPKLLRTYLACGAKICGPPAIDRAFGTIDFLTVLDLQAMPDSVSDHFLR